jgi:exonuclease VII small subunit
MKTIFNHLKRFGSAGASMFIVAAVISTPSLALTAPRTTPSTPTDQACARLTTFSTTGAAKLKERQAAMEVDFAKRQSNITSRHDAADQKVVTFRTTLSDKFDAKVTDLKSKEGLSEAQLAAINTYEKDMKAAKQTREEAVDAARETYRAGLIKEVEAHQAALRSAVTTYQTAVEAMTTLKSSLQAARESFQAARKASKAQPTIKELVTTRTEAIKAANAEFAEKAKVYGDTLKSVLEQE